MITQTVEGVVTQTVEGVVTVIKRTVHELSLADLSSSSESSLFIFAVVPTIDDDDLLSLSFCHAINRAGLAGGVTLYCDANPG